MKMRAAPAMIDARQQNLPVDFAGTRKVPVDDDTKHKEASYRSAPAM